MSDNEIWKKFLEIIKKNLNPISFTTWFEDTKLYKIDDETITLEVPMALHKKMILTNYNDLVSDTFTEITGVERKIECLLRDEIDSKVDKLVNNISEDIVDNDEVIDNFESNLKPNLTFDNFVVGDSNKFARTAALAVADNPGSTYNPLFIYGKSGLGKTHLMHAIGNYIVQNNPDMKVLYTTSDNFRKDYANISNNGNSLKDFDNFKSKYRNVDVLIIDDIQYLTNAQKTQEEFFHTFNELHNKGKQIIISSDSSPDDLKVLEERLRSRFNWGLPVDIYPPEFDLRCRIIKDKIKHSAISSKITDEAIEFIANNFEGDVRKIESAINRLVAFTAMSVPDIIDLEFTNEALKDIVGKYNPYNTNDVVSIQKAVADYYGITVEMLKGKKRSNNIAYPRMVAMYLCRMLTDQSFPRIGLEFGGRDHSTVIHGVDKIEDDLKSNKELKNILDEIKKKL